MVISVEERKAGRDWQQLVDRGRLLAAFDRGETRFELGDIALEIEPMAEVGESTGSLVRLDLYGADIGVSFETLRQYRAVSAAYPNGMRNTICPWTVHQKFMGELDRAELVQRQWTPQEIAALKAERHAKVAPKRDERWWKAIQDELAALRKLNLTKPPRGVSVAVARQRAKVIREQIELAEQLAAMLEKYGATPRH